jgi:hypothetical protein
MTDTSIMIVAAVVAFARRRAGGHEDLPSSEVESAAEVST